MTAIVKLGGVGFILWFLAAGAIILVNMFPEVFSDDAIDLTLIIGTAVIALALLFVSIALFGLFKHHGSRRSLGSGIIGIFSMIMLSVTLIIPFTGMPDLLGIAGILALTANMLICTFMLLLGIALINLEGVLGSTAILPAGIVAIVTGIMCLSEPSTVYTNLALIPMTLLGAIAFFRAR